MFKSITIQLEWMIEEYVRISFKLIWFNPPRLPIIEEKIIKKIVKNFLLKYLIKTKGAIFCHTIIIKHIIQFNDFIIWGNQKWKGAIPDFIARAMKTNELNLWIKKYEL